MEEMCVMDYSEDLQYWKIDDIWLEQCYENKFNTRKDYIFDEIRKEKVYEEACMEIEEDFGDGKLTKYQRILWDTFEKTSKVCPTKVHLPPLYFHGAALHGGHVSQHNA